MEVQRRHARLTGVVLFFIIASARANAQAASPSVDVDIPAGDAIHTLPLFYAQTKIEMLYLTDTLRGLQTGAVHGHFKPSDVLKRMLEGTGLEFEFEADYTFVSIKPHEENPRPAVVGVAPPRDSGLGPSEFAGVPFAADKKLEEVVVTGSLIRGVLDIVSPLVHSTREDMKSTAYASVQEALQALPLVSRSGPSEVSDPGGNFGRGSSVNLRGLGARATLVLVNGRRQAPSGANADFVDVSNIPWAAVKRIDVLPDGASALYGSDAVAGVVNIIMRDDLDGAETQMRIATTAGGGDEALVGQLFGTRWSSGKAFVAYQFSRRDALPAYTRRYAASSDKTFLGGANYGSLRSNPGNLIDPFTGQSEFSIPQGQDGSSLTLDKLQEGVSNLQNRLADVDLWPQTKMNSVYLSGSQSLSPRLNLFAEGRFSQRDMAQRYYAADGLLLVPSTNPFFVDAFGAPFTVVAYSFDKDLGPVTATGRTRNYAGTFGLSADLGGSWTASLSRSHAAENLRWIASNQVDLDALNQALSDPDPRTAFNPFGDGSHTNPQTLASIRAVDAEGAAASIVTTSVVADGPLLDLPAGRASLADGVDVRTETLVREAVTRTTYARSVRSAFAELAIPLIGERSNPRATPSLQLSLAARGEHYSDFGSTFNPKIGLQAILSSALKLRGTWGTSFSAPRLVDLYDTSQNRAALVTVADRQAAEGQSLVLLTQGNNPALREERATTWTAGVDFAPAWASELAISLTYFHIRYTDRVFLPAPPLSLDAILQEDQWAELVTRNPSAQAAKAICTSSGFMGSAEQCELTPPDAIIDARPRNLSLTVLRGLDLSVSRSLETPFGQIHFALNGSYLLAFDQALTRASPVIDVIDTVDNPVARRLHWTVSWDEHGANRPGFGARLSLDYAGHYRDDVSVAHPAIKAWTTADLQASYRTSAGAGAFDGLEIDFNINNVLNADPPFVDRELGYDVANARPYGRVLGLYMRETW